MALASHPTFSASARTFRASRRATFSSRVCPSSQTRPQKPTPFWAQRFKNRSGKGPQTVKHTLPRRKFTMNCMLALPSQVRSTPAISPVMRSSEAFMARRVRPLPRTFTMSFPPLMWISSVP